MTQPDLFGARSRALTRSIAVSLVCLGYGHFGCATTGREPGAYSDGALALKRVVLYRNGVGYFERSGTVDGKVLRLKVRKDQVNDLLKSLVVVDRDGRVLGVSLPLDPQSWHRAALAALTPGNGKLAGVLDSLRGTPIRVDTRSRRVQGRIVMVERMEPVSVPIPGPVPFVRASSSEPAEPFEDHKLTLLDGDAMHVVRLSEVESLTLLDGDVAMQIDRHLDASAGEGMFQQVTLEIRLEKDTSHALALSYVAQAPLWKPTYRLVIDEARPGKALLQGWAVVDNTSGESWRDVELSLTSGAPLAFRYDMHSPREVERPDLSHSAVHKEAQVALGERTFGQEPAPPPAPAAPAPMDPDSAEQSAREEAEAGADDMAAETPARGRRSSAKKLDEAEIDLMQRMGQGAGGMAVRPESAAPQGPAMTYDAMQQSAAAQARASRVAGLTRFDLPAKVTLPDGSATMVALINQEVSGEQVLLYRPGGSGQGYEQNPYRVVRFQNDTAFVLEPGPISIYSGGSFVGEGLSEAVGSRERAVIPFAVEPSVVVRKDIEHYDQKVDKVKLVRGVLEIESFQRVKTNWVVQADGGSSHRVLIRQPRRGGSYKLVDPPADTEDLPDAYLVPVTLPKGQKETTLSLTEQTPTKTSLSLWEGGAIELLDLVLASPDLDPAERARLQPIVEARRELGRIDTEVQSLSQQKAELDARAQETRASLKSIDKDKRAGELRKRLQKRLEEVLQEADALSRRIVELQSKRLEKKIELEDLLERS